VASIQRRSDHSFLLKRPSQVDGVASLVVPWDRRGCDSTDYYVYEVWRMHMDSRGKAIKNEGGKLMNALLLNRKLRFKASSTPARDT
jgi:hypothetical protein